MTQLYNDYSQLILIKFIFEEDKIIESILIHLFHVL